MPPELDNAAIIAGLLILGIFICSALLWISYISGNERHLKKRSLVPTWSIGWINFGLFLCVLVINISLTQFIAAKLVHHFSEPVVNEPEIEAVDIPHETTETPQPSDTEIIEKSENTNLNPWLVVLSLLSMQIPMIVTFFGLRKFYPESFGGSINQKPVSIQKAISETIPYFIRCFPIIWLTGLIWFGLLAGLQKFELIDEAPPQQIVILISNAESPTAIAVITLCAVILAPVTEELIFRGSIYRFLKGQTSLLAAQIASGTLFAIMHHNLMSFLPLLVIGIVLARIYEKEGNILLPIIFHASWNGLSMLILLLSTQSKVPFGPN